MSERVGPAERRPGRCRRWVQRALGSGGRQRSPVGPGWISRHDTILAMLWSLRARRAETATPARVELRFLPRRAVDADMDASSRPPSRPPAFLPLDKLAAFGVINVFALFLLIQWRLDKRIARSRDNLAARLGPGATTKSRPLVLGFFHPFCNAGGGGELVLWTAVSHMQRVSPKTVCAIYTGDWPTASKDQILDKAMVRFALAWVWETRLSRATRCRLGSTSRSPPTPSSSCPSRHVASSPTRTGSASP